MLHSVVILASSALFSTVLNLVKFLNVYTFELHQRSSSIEILQVSAPALAIDNCYKY